MTGADQLDPEALLDAPDWLLAEISTISKLVRAAMACLRRQPLSAAAH